jgi:hypothetical protein
MAKQQINLTQIRKTNARKLEQLLSNPKKVERLAKKQYGDGWKIIYAGERHYYNSQVDKK